MTSNSDKHIAWSYMDWILALGVGLASLTLYIRTLAPGPLPSDSGEFQILVYQLGIAHCPGYPIYLLLAKLFTLLPVGEMAYRINLFSALMAAVTISGVYLVSRLLSANRLVALFGALVLAVSLTFWSQAVIAEVYTAGAAFVAWILVFVLGWQSTGKPWYLFGAGVLGGLSLGIHTTVVVIAPGILFYLWYHRKERPNFWRHALGGAAVGILVWFLAFVWIDWNAPPANIFNGAYETARSAWDLSLEDIQNPWKRIWFIATAQQWRSALKFDPGHMVGEIGNYLYRLPDELSWAGIFFSIWGLAYFFRTRKDLAALFSISLVIHWAISFNYQIGDIFVFYITGYVLLVILATIGLERLGLWIRKITPNGGPVFQTIASIAVIIFSVWILLAPRWGSVQRGEVPFIGEPNFLLWEDPAPTNRIITRTVEQMKPNTVVFMDWYWLYTYYYIAHVELGRTDLRFIEPTPRADKWGLPDSVIEFVEANIDSRPIYFSQPFAEVEAAGFKFYPTEIWFTPFYKVMRP